jgi:hypothetical protein
MRIPSHAEHLFRREDEHFRGVATCYLDSYLGWFRTFDRNSLKRFSPVQWLTLALNRPCPAT